LNIDLTRFDQLAAQVAQFVRPVSDLTVTDAATNAIASGSLKTIREMLNEIETRRTEITVPLNETLKSVNNYAKQVKQPLEDADAHIRAHMTAYANKLKEEAAALAREAEERRRDEERLVRLEQERVRSELEAKRKEQEAAAQKAKEAADLFGGAQQEIERKEREAKHAAELLRFEAEARFKREQLEREARQQEERRAAEASRPKNTREVWKFEVVDALAVPDRFKSVNEVAVGAAVRNGTRDIPGIRIFSETIVVAR